MKSIQIVLFFLLLLSPFLVKGQSEVIKWEASSHASYTFIHDDENVIDGHNKLDSFFYKLVMLRHTRKGRVNIVHIGDSHLQADGITKVVRSGFQQYFGDAGRGLVFPYQLANSNAPNDIRSSSNTTWKSNRLTSPDKPIKTGISGYGIHSAGKGAFVNLQLRDKEGRQDSFNRMVFFLNMDTVCYRLSDSNLAEPILVNTITANKGLTTVVNTYSMLKGFELRKLSAPDETEFGFYGVSLEKRDNAGVLYHTIGVNGARYDQFLQSNLFWQQLKALQGDLFIVSLGTNEAQNQFINEQTFTGACDSFVKLIHKIAPNACVLLTTPSGSYFKVKKPNKSIQTIATALTRYAGNNNVACWDLFKVSSGFAGTAAWKKYNLMSHDGVHYNNAGYQLQGTLLLNAFAAEYNNYEKTHPYKTVPKISDIIVKPVIAKTDHVAHIVPPAAVKPPMELKPAPPKEKVVLPETIGPPKRKSNIVVEYAE